MRLNETSLILRSNNFFFIITRYFGGTHLLIHKKCTSFVYIFVANHQFSQITLSEAENRHALLHEQYFSKHCF